MNKYIRFKVCNYFLMFYFFYLLRDVIGVVEGELFCLIMFIVCYIFDI